MKLLNKLKNDRQDLISNLLDNIESLEKLAFEQQSEIERLLQKLQQAQSEAIKEFENKAIEKAYINNYCEMVVNVASIEAIAKEMVGE